MYIIEFILKKIFSKKDNNEIEFLSDLDDYESCEHVFMPIDSTNTILSCTKCGKLIKNEDYLD